MKDQILKILEAEGLTPAKFADEIGVQRSSVSHIISGRNKPSFDFIMKIIERFRGINTEWLLTGKGPMIKSASSDQFDGKSLLSTKVSDIESRNNESGSSYFEPEESPESVDITSKEKISYTKLSGRRSESDVKFTNVNKEKFILVFYEDGSFKKFISRE